MSRSLAMVGFLLGLLPGVAEAEDLGGGRWLQGQTWSASKQDAFPSAQRSSDAACVGAFLPFGQPAHLSGVGYAVSAGGYDSTRRTGLFDTNLEARILGPLALRVGSAYSPETRRMRPTIGMRVGLLDAARHGLDVSAGVLYRPEGFTETDGEIEGALAIGADVHGTMLLGNLMYGQDPEGYERDGELRLALLRRLGGRIVLGLDSRGRLNLVGNGRGTRGEPRFDGVAGPAATLVVGPAAILLTAGGSIVQLDGSTPFQYGIYVMGGLGLGM